MNQEFPSVSVIIATHDRPQLLAKAIEAVRAQDYAGQVQCVVVFDRNEPDATLVRTDASRPVVVVTNDRTPGLAGARNAGAAAASGELLAFCDDDDEWLPAKLRLQAGRLAETGADVAVSGIHVSYGDKTITRVPRPEDVTHAELLRRRVMEAHPSTVVVRRTAFLGKIGQVDEEIPGSYGEDYDWMLRAAAAGPIAVVPEPLVTVLWGQTSHFNRKWRTISDALQYLLHKHPAFADDPRGLARVQGQIAFAHAALGERSAARTWALRTLRNSWRERRAYLALLVSLRVLSADRVLRLAHATGRGV
ncbi:glycosyltransferase [Actinoallomurus bryophytorum]|uniref:GT2 family glycosyltransferase n=1 Tax=Actinoallomurus bryophytorum TaxID=1490222 RepID=A0A543CFI1_9ACTN|nr:glycosyltransferase family A protein [Actinoallomurus bryophytorum]TQL95866.1 GT2 family glycosyltransferase [Actinoallomurus bryophytorum]